MYNTKEYYTEKNNQMIFNIYDKIAPYSIFSKYLGKFVIGRAYNSPLRDDKNASFAIFVDKKTGTLLYKDLATGDCGDAIKFVKIKFNLKNTKEAISYIKKDFSMSNLSDSHSAKSTYVSERKSMQVRSCEFNSDDLKYWNDYGISEETLNKFNVKSIVSYYTNGALSYTKRKNELMFAYRVFSNIKIYRPFAPKISKWRGNLSNYDIFGYQQLPEKAEILFFTKALKDVMVLNEFGYSAVAPPSEMSVVPKEVISELNRRFKRIVILFDRDAAGINAARKLVAKTKWDFLFINKKYGAKDISDLVLSAGADEAKKVIDNCASASTLG